MVRVVTDTMSKEECPVHEGEGEGCPPLCRHVVRFLLRPVVEVLGEWRQNFLSLQWMVDAGGGQVMTPTDDPVCEKYEEACKIGSVFALPVAAC